MIAEMQANVNTVWLCLITTSGAVLTALFALLSKRIDNKLKESKKETSENKEHTKKVKRDVDILIDKTDENYKDYNNELEKIKTSKLENQKKIATIEDEIRTLKEAVSKEDNAK